MREFTINFTGDLDVLRRLEALPARAQQRVLKPLMREGARQIAAAAKSEAPARTGLLATSLGPSKLRTYSGTQLFVAVGVRRGFRRAIHRTARGTLRYRSKKATAAAGPDAQIANPVKYLHLVTGGRKAVAAAARKSLYSAMEGRFFGRSVAAAAPNPFMTRMFDSVAGSVVANITARAAVLIEAEAAE